MGKQTVVVNILANTSGFRRGIDHVTGALGTLTSTATKTVGALGLSFAGLAATKGIARSMKIEEAQAKLRALGADAATVSQVSEDALKSVKGTAYGLDAAATAAASAMAAQIKPGKDMARYLSLVADTAQIAGVSMEEMGSIFGKVATNQKVTTMEMNQLADKGIPIWKYLSDEYGVSTEALRKMVTDGKVDLDHFLSAIEKNIGGAGKIMADTTKGAWSNMLAAVSRFGQVAASPIFPHIKTVFFEMTKGIDALTSAIKPYADRLAEFLGPRIQALLSGVGERVAGKIIEGANRLSELPTRVAAVMEAVKSRIRNATGVDPDAVAARFTAIAGKITVALRAMLPASLPEFANGIGEKLGSVFETLRPIMQGTFSALAPLLAPIKEAFSQIVPVITQLIGPAAQLASAFSPVHFLMQSLVPMLPKIAGALTTGISAALPIITNLVTTLGNTLAPLLPTISLLVQNIAEQIGGVLTDALVSIMPTVVVLIKTIADVVTAILPSLTPLLQGIADVVQAVVQAVMPLVPIVTALVTRIVGMLVPILPSLGTLLATVATLLGHLFTALSPLLTAIGNVASIVLNVLSAILTPLIGALTTVAQIIMDVLSTAISALDPIISAIVAVLSTFANVLTGVVATAIQFIAGIFNTVWTGVYLVTQTVWTAISTTIGSAVRFISTIVSTVISTITNIFNGGWNAIVGAARDAMNWLQNAVAGGISGVLGLIASLPSRALGALGNLGSALWNAGSQLIQGFIDGIKHMFGKVKDSLGWLTNKLTSWKGPESLDRRLLTPAGSMIIDGLINGFERRFPAVRSSLGGLTDMISNTSFDALDPNAISAAGGHVTVVNIRVDAQMLEPTPENGRKLADSLNEYMRLNGVNR